MNNSDVKDFFLFETTLLAITDNKIVILPHINKLLQSWERQCVFGSYVHNFLVKLYNFTNEDASNIVKLYNFRKETININEDILEDLIKNDFEHLTDKKLKEWKYRRLEYAKVDSLWNT